VTVHLTSEVPARPALPRGMRTLTEMLCRLGVEIPGALAIGFVDSQMRSDDVSYGELYHQSLRVARWLHAHGVSQGDRILLIYPTGREFVMSFFGAILAGATPVPFTPPTGLAKIDTYLPGFTSVARSCRASLCLTSARLALVLRGAAQDLAVPMHVTAVDLTALPEPAGLAPIEASPADLAFLQYTSGSTSEPKGVMLTHGNLIANISAFTDALAVRPGDVVVSWLPLFHDMGLIGMLMGALYARIPLYVIAPELFIRSPELWLKAITRWGATLTCAPNFAFHYCVKQIPDTRLGDFKLDTLRAVLNGAEPVDLGAITSFETKFASAGLRKDVIVPVYGLAESALAVCFPEVGRVTTAVVDLDHLESTGEARAPEHGARRKTLVSVGRAIATQQIEIWTPSHRRMPEDRVGEIMVRGPSVMRGYYGNAADTANALTDGWLHTGDFGYLSGGQLYITGRKKDLIIRRGRNYFPQDIEAIVGSVPGVRKGRVVAFGVATSDFETEIAIVAETRLDEAAERTRLVGEIRLAVSRHFPFSPFDVKLVEPGAIPRTSSGKIRRQPCKDRYLQGTLERDPRGLGSRLWILKALAGNARHAVNRILRWRRPDTRAWQP